MLRGVDLSAYQVGVNYAALGGSVDFAYVKCCDWNGSAWVQDAMLPTNVAGLIDYAVPFGLYCFGHPSQDVLLCATAFKSFAAGWGAKLRPCIDMESLSQGHVPTNAGQWCLSWCNMVAYALDYASDSYYEEMVRQAPALVEVPLWRAEYHQTCPQAMPPGPAAVALQWTGHGRIDGITGNADLDVIYSDDLSGIAMPDSNLGMA